MLIIKDIHLYINFCKIIRLWGEIFMGERNKYGLSRDIPNPVMREVRQRCGFGCVSCGSAIYQYEHVDPKFAEAEKHDPDSIVLLCGACHDRVTKGLLSKETVKRMSLKPKCKEQGFSFGPFDIGVGAPEIVVGTFRGTNIKTLIQIYDDAILSVRPPSDHGMPFLINAWLCDREGKELLRIEDNTWKTPSNNWDVEIVGSRITIRKKKGDIVLVLRSDPPHRLVVEKIDMEHKGMRIRSQEGDAMEVITSSGSLFHSTGITVKDCEIGIKLNSSGFCIGVGSGSTYISTLTLGGKETNNRPQENSYNSFPTFYDYIMLSYNYHVANTFSAIKRDKSKSKKINSA